MDYTKHGVHAKQRALNAKAGKWGKKLLLTCFELSIIAIVGVGICAIAAGLGLFRSILEDTPNIRVDDVVASGQATIVYDCEGNEIDQYVSTNSNRIEVTIDQVPKHLGQAFVAIEDVRFYQHNGIDFWGIGRSAYQFLKTLGKEKQGASTITQQLLKNTVFTSWTDEHDNLVKMIKRKLQEQYLALELTKVSSKDDVLLRYMNAINLGQNTLGVESASLRYFGKSCSELTISESAVIASITQNPSANNPIRYPKNNARRRADCLSKMKKLEFITEDEYEIAMADTEAVYQRISNHDIDFNVGDSTSGSYFSDAVFNQVQADLIAAGYSDAAAEYMMYSGGLRIDSTMDPKIQQIVDEEFANEENYNTNVHWYLSYALTIIDSDNEKHNYSKENMMSWFKENVNRNFNLIFASQDDAYDAIDTYRAAMMEEVGLPADSNSFEETVSMAPQPQAAMVIEDPATGYVVAMEGGRGAKEGRRTLNRATSAGNSPGSTFKVLAAFAPALDACGQTLATPYNDAPFNYDGGTPVGNWYESSGTPYRGIKTIRSGITESLNIVAVKTITVVSPQLAYTYLLNFGFTTLTDGTWIGDQFFTDVRQPTALGGITNGVSPFELNAAYSSIANLGNYMTPKLYTRVTDSDGNIILDNTNPVGKRVLKESTAFLLTDAMVDVVTSGAGTGGKCNFNSSMAIAGKTGTSQKYQDVWFAGFTPYYAATVWAGYDNNVSLKTGGDREDGVAKSLWRSVMKRIHEDLPNASFTVPSGLVRASVCTKSGKIPNPGLCDAAGCVRTEYFSEGTTPTEICDIHYQGQICSYDNMIASPGCPFAYEGVATLPLPEYPALIEGSTTIITNPDGTQSINVPNTSNVCQHNEAFFANPDWESIVEQQRWELEWRAAAAAEAAAAEGN